MYAVGKVPNDQTPANTKSLFDLRGGTSLVPDQWNNVTVNMKDYYDALAAQGSNRLPWADIIIQCAVALSEYVLPTPYVEAPWVDPMTGQETPIATGTFEVSGCGHSGRSGYRSQSPMGMFGD
ncbi:hypothetical protein HK097_002878 [Rhizophlyctis rosea]|uniref:Uncharacterized protein n=1 Tax=Rhizophlyctis rosea TaxID=64517 RepID=A0AAD5SF92_9FUNG|nr:hypothetical protein HK097_002878 [Rhizophlyctis rosea]